MKTSKIASKALALLFQTGIVGLSSALATTSAAAETTTPLLPGPTTVSHRLSAIRSAVSEAAPELLGEEAPRAKLTLADWLNFGGGLGWRNGGWRNGGWGNGGWHNGGWGNGGWHNGGWGNGGWRNGWHNGWHNFWHNW